MVDKSKAIKATNAFKLSNAAKKTDAATEKAKKCIAAHIDKAKTIAALTAAQKKFDCTDALAMRNYSNLLTFSAFKNCNKELNDHVKKNMAWKKLGVKL